MKRRILFLLVLLTSSKVLASGNGLTIKSIYYCGSDFSMLMSNNERWVVRKSDVGEQKMNHFLSMALFMMASNKKTANVFPGEPLENWCGTSNVRPITIFSFSNG
ncbi:hypothetical protein SOPP22_01405 [Shewanella sp. OPT22]|nr:hypothetical protein SOPP22_01405 [Shewanella sp. OPT22]